MEDGSGENQQSECSSGVGSAEENEKHWRDALSRIYKLEQAVQALETEIRQPTTEKPQPKPSQRSAAATQISAAHSSAAPPSPGDQ